MLFKVVRIGENLQFSFEILTINAMSIIVKHVDTLQFSFEILTCMMHILLTSPLTAFNSLLRSSGSHMPEASGRIRLKTLTALQFSSEILGAPRGTWVLATGEPFNSPLRSSPCP
jgi:hypothetical protein